MKHYADSSFLVSCYLPEANTARAKAWLVQNSGPLPFNDLHGLEIPNAIRLSVFRRAISQAQADAALAEIGKDLAAGRLVDSPVDWPAAFRAAARLSEQHSARSGSRSLDILYIAVAKLARSTDFVTFDIRQSALAVAAGLKTVP